MKDWIVNHLKGGCSRNVDRNVCVELNVEINLLLIGWILDLNATPSLEGRHENVQCWKRMLECSWMLDRLCNMTLSKFHLLNLCKWESEFPLKIFVWRIWILSKANIEEIPAHYTTHNACSRMVLPQNRVGTGVPRPYPRRTRELLGLIKIESSFEAQFKFLLCISKWVSLKWPS